SLGGGLRHRSFRSRVSRLVHNCKRWAAARLYRTGGSWGTGRGARGRLHRSLNAGEIAAGVSRRGAFDRRAYLSQQGVDLVGALRAPDLLELVKPAGPSMFAWVSRGRRRLREEVDR